MFKLSVLFCCLLLAISWHKVSSSNRLKNTYDTFGVILNLYFGIDASKTISEFLKNEESTLTEGEHIVISKLNQLSQDIQAAKSAILFKISDTLRTKLGENIQSLFQMAADVEFVYKRYLNIYTNMRKHTVDELVDFSKTLTLHQNNLINGFERILFRMHEVLTNGDEKLESTLSIINKESSQLSLICSRRESSQQLIKDLYNLVVDTHTKGLHVRKFAFTFREQHENQNYQQNIDDDLREFKEAVNNTYLAVENAMKAAPRTLYSCDPNNWVQGENYEQLGPALQTHIVVSSDLPNVGGSCSPVKEKHRYVSDDSRQLEVSKRCHEGYMMDCSPFGSSFEVCYSSKSSPRLYDWAKPSSSDIFGYKNITNCSNMTKEIDIGFFRRQFQNHCLCTCDSGRRAEDRYFSLRSVETDAQHTKRVVTGAQLVKIGRVFYIKIQEGKFGPNGNITSIPVWRDVPEPFINNHWKTISKYVSSTTKTRIPYTHVYKDEVKKYTFNTIFHENPYMYPVTYDWRKVQLDEVDVGPNRVITGLKFSQSGSDLILEVRATPCDYEKGELFDVESHWINAASSFKGVRQEIVLNEPEVPSASDPNAEFEISGNGHYVRFTTTDNRKDLGQNMVPFIDTQPITTNPPMPLTAAGLILKRKGYSGGFLALKLNHYDLVS